MRSTRIVTVLIGTISLITSLSLAAAAQPFSSLYNTISNGRALITLGGGAVVTSDVGQSHNFPVVNPETDSFYNYTANNASQTRAGFTSFVGGEWSLYPQWALQLGLGFNGTESLRAKGSLLQGADIQSSDLYAYNYSVVTRQVLLSTKLLHPYKDHFFPYAVLGLGAAINRASNYSTTMPPFISFTRIYKSHNQTSFSYQLGAGIDMDIASHLRAGVGYRFADLGKATLGSAIIDTTSVSGTLSKNHLYANEVLAELTWLI